MTSGSDVMFFPPKNGTVFWQSSPTHPPKKKGPLNLNLVPVLPVKLGISTNPRNEKTAKTAKDTTGRKTTPQSCFMAWGPSKHVVHKILLLLYGYVIPTRFHHLKSSKKNEFWTRPVSKQYSTNMCCPS